MSGVVTALSGVLAATAATGPTLISHTGMNGGVNGGVTNAIDTTGANLIVVTMSYFAGGLAVPGVSDSKSNTWTARTTYDSGSNTAIKTFYSYAPTVGSGHTFTFTGTFSYSSATVSAWSGIATPSYDTENGTTYTSSTTSFPTGSVTPSQGNTLLIAGLSFDLGGAGTAVIGINSGFTITDTVAYSVGNGVGASMAYKILTSATATNPTFTSDISATAGTNITVFKY